MKSIYIPCEFKPVYNIHGEVIGEEPVKTRETVRKEKLITGF